MADALASSRRELLEAAHAVSSGSAPEVTADLIDRYFHGVASEDLLTHVPDAIAGLVRSHVELADSRPAGAAAVRVFTPSTERDGWSGEGSVVQVVTDDMPFLVDSVAGAISDQGLAVHLVIHPVFHTRRNAVGALEELDPTAPAEQGAGGFGETKESWICLLVDPVDAATCGRLTEVLRGVLVDVREAVEDWDRMRRRCLDLADDLAAHTPTGIEPDDAAGTAEFLRWIAANHFTFLGYREYALTQTPEGETITPEPGSGLGILRSDPKALTPSILSERASAKAHQVELLIVTKANSRATVHRPVYLDYVSVKRINDEGAVVGEHRFLGLFASNAYIESVTKIPIVRDKVRDIIARSGATSDSHTGKDLLGILENYPRDELFQASADHLAEVAMAVLPLRERLTTRLFLRNDEFGRFVSCLVYLPRDHYNTTVRMRLAAILRQAFGGASVDYTTRVSETALSRLHFVVRMPQGVAIPDLTDQERADLEEKVLDAARSWDEKVYAAARQAKGSEEAARLRGLYGRAFPTAYEQRFGMASTLADIRHLDRVAADEDPDRTDLTLYRGDSPRGMRRFKLFRRRPISLTKVLPLFTNLGVEVVDEQPYEVSRSDGHQLYVYDIGLRVESEDIWTQLPHEELRDLFESAFAAVWSGQAESDGFNALVLGAGLTWRQVVILRLVAKFLRQAGSTYSQEYVEATLRTHAGLARLLVRLFEVRFDPAAYAADEAGQADRAAAADAIAAEIRAGLDAVTSLDHDRIVRALLGIILAGLRTNFYQPGPDGQPKSYVSLKLNPKAIPDLPAPRPKFEIWVYSPRVEGVHLRFGPVARGGLRWSDRREDFRTEILGLVKAQMVKNAVIVPTGSKGGFFAKQLPDPTADRDAWLAEGIEAYKLFISGLLDLTDNRTDGGIVPPADVVRHDGDDPYLVVAADKGTATFSDIANGVAQSYGFWLDDAFASGGSAGYDHKAMGITARGAWESVKRHFREMGVDTQSEEFTVVGIGDMSGDVFGNGMLLSEQIRLVAAFDHRHIFIDPTPDASAGFVERKRLFELPRSSWADYDTGLISAGGGVFARSLKSIPISAEMATALGIASGTTSMTPAELMRAILLAPVDLLWNGGIGTYVKASTEDDAAVGDRANDAIRVTGKDLRAKVVGEGGNLGLTQLGRIEAALKGVRVNTDAIDNSAGVDTSDHEVNIKILLGDVVRKGGLELQARNELLASMTDDVATAVLDDNYEQNVLLGNARAQEASMLSVHQRLIHSLEDRGDLDRALEFLPTDSVLNARQRDGLGLKSPEFAVLVAYTKLALKQDLLASGLPDDPWFAQTLADYFPPALRSRYAAELAEHPLRREIITNAVANNLVNRGGITFVFRSGEETGSTPEQVARAYVVCREVFDLASFVTAVEALDNRATTAAQTQLYLEFRRLLDRSVRWFLATRPIHIDIAAEIDRYKSAVDEIGPRVPDLLRGAEAKRLERRARELEKLSIPAPLARRTASLLDQYALLDIVDIAHDTGEPVGDVTALYFVVSERFGIDAMLGRVTKLPRDDQWDALARGAVRDDLYAVLDQLVRAVIAHGPGEDPVARTDAWSKANQDAVSRSKKSLAGILRLEAPNLAAVSVALRTLRSVVRAGGGTPAGSG